MPNEDKTERALETRITDGDRLFSPSTARNRDPIREVFLAHMPLSGAALEIGAGTGEHAVHIASAATELSWHTGDPDPRSRASIAAWIAHENLPNLSGPHAIDVTKDEWGVDERAPFDAMISMNMIHIAPFDAAIGLFAGAKRHLAAQGKLFLYGPYSRNGVHTAPSNESFDASLKARDPSWGVRDLEGDILPLAKNADLNLETIVEMPANNFALIFKKPS